MTSTAPQFSFTPATSDDLAEINGLVHSAYAKYIERIGRKPAPMNDDYAQLIAHGQLSVARNGADILGVLAVEIMPDHLHVTTVAVSPFAQGLGVGTALLKHAEDWALSAGLQELRLYTNAKMYENLEFYPRRGFTEVDRRTEDGYDRVYYSRKL